MSRFFPRDVIHWGEEKLHPLRAFAIRTVEPAGITGLVLRGWRAVILGSGSWLFFIIGLTLGVLFLCGMLTWHLGNYPVRRWPLRALAFFVIEFAVEMGMSSVLIVLGRERYGSQLAGWGAWWPARRSGNAASPSRSSPSSSRSSCRWCGRRSTSGRRPLVESKPCC